MEYLKHNIRYLRELKGLKQDEMAQIFDVKRDNIASYERGTEPKLAFILKFVNYFHISLSDLMNVDLAINQPKIVALPTSEKTTNRKKKRYVEIIHQITSDKASEPDEPYNTPIPLYSTIAAAGLTEVIQDEQHNVLDKLSIPNLPKCDGAIHITGDSMYPLLKSGDIVIYKRIKDILNSIIWGEMYLLTYLRDDDYYTAVKYIKKSDRGDEWIKLVSQNQHHEPIDIMLNHITALALIKASIRFNSMN